MFPAVALTGHKTIRRNCATGKLAVVYPLLKELGDDEADTSLPTPTLFSSGQ